MFGCFASTTRAVTYADEKVPEVKLTRYGEYSAVPVLSPIGKVNEPAPEYIFFTTPDPSATIIFDDEGVPPIDAEVPSVSVFDPMFNNPFVSVSAPSRVTSPPSEIPFARFSVKLFSVTEGSAVPAPAPPKVIFDVLPPVRLPLVVAINPLSVKVFAPIDNAPLVNVSVPSRVTFPPSEIPFARFSVKLFSVTAGSAVLAPAPPKIIFDVLPPVILPPDVDIAPLIVNVFATIDNAPFVSVSVPSIVISLFSVTPELLLITMLGNALLPPIVCADDPLN